MAALSAIPETRAAAVEIYSMAATDPLLPLEIVLSSRRKPSSRKVSRLGGADQWLNEGKRLTRSIRTQKIMDLRR